MLSASEWAWGERGVDCPFSVGGFCRAARFATSIGAGLVVFENRRGFAVAYFHFGHGFSKELTAKRSVYTDVVPSVDSETKYVWAFDGSDKSIKDADAKALFSVSAKGTGALKYQWFVEEDGEASPIAKAVLLEADWDSGDISVFLADQSGELLVYSAQTLAGIEAPDSMPLGTVRYDASTTATFLAGGSCILNIGGRNVPAKYTYKKAVACGSMAMLNVDLTVSKTKYTAELPLFFVKTGFADYIAYLKSGKFFETQTGTLAFPKK